MKLPVPTGNEPYGSTYPGRSVSASAEVGDARLRTHMEGVGTGIDSQVVEMRRAQEFDQRVIADMPVAMMVITPDLEVIYANRACLKALGLGHRGIGDRPLTEDVSNLDGIRALVSETMMSRTSVREREVFYQHPAVGRRWFHVSASCLGSQEMRLRDGENPQLVLCLENVTEWRKAREKLRETGRLTSLGEFVAEVAHELNNPLTTIMGYAQLALEQEPEGQCRGKLEMILSEAQRATRLVHDFLSFAKKRRVKKSSVDPAAPVERVLARKASDLRSTNIKVVTSFATHLPSVFADEEQLERVFFNIVTNAQQSMAEVNWPGRIVIQGKRTARMVMVSFEDNGPGIPESNFMRIFDPLFTTKRAPQSTGLGLSICKSLVQEQGGRIWAESEPGKGATFYVELPVFKG